MKLVRHVNNINDSKDYLQMFAGPLEFQPIHLLWVQQIELCGIADDIDLQHETVKMWAMIEWNDNATFIMYNTSNIIRELIKSDADLQQ